MDEFILAAKRTPVDIVEWLGKIMEDPEFRASSRVAESVETKQSDALETYSNQIKSTAGLAFLDLLARFDDIILMRGFLLNKKSKPFTCKRCEQLLVDLKTCDLERDSLDDGAQKGCRLCQMILDCFPTSDSPQTSDPFSKTVPQSSPRLRNKTHAVLKVGRQSRTSACSFVSR
jgi:hypothetical protein